MPSKFRFSTFDSEDFLARTMSLSVSLPAAASKIEGIQRFGYVSESWVDGGATGEMRAAVAGYIRDERPIEEINNAINQLTAWLKFDMDEMKSFVREEWSRRGAMPFVSDGYVDKAFDSVKGAILELTSLRAVMESIRDGTTADFEEAVGDAVERSRSVTKLLSENAESLRTLGAGKFGF